MADLRLVCLHGLGRGPADWDAVRGRLEIHGPVRTPALPRDADAALAAARAAIAPGTVVIGHSIGGIVALRIARAAAGIRGVVLMGCPFGARHARRRPELRERGQRSGQIVGWADTPSGAQHAFLFSSGHMTDIGRLVPGAVASQAPNITNAGDIVGTGTRANGSTVGFLYRAGAVTLLQSRTVTCCQTVGDGLNQHLQIIAHGLIGGFIAPVLGRSRRPTTIRPRSTTRAPGPGAHRPARGTAT
jgi:probable HAF family extracellular repeat protein